MIWSPNGISLESLTCLISKHDETDSNIKAICGPHDRQESKSYDLEHLDLMVESDC